MLGKRPKFITEFLIPSLNSERFGNHLKWLDRRNSVFQLSWCHKGFNHWSEVEAQVFVEWDKMKGHYQPNEKEYFTNSKQRFRALLNKLSLTGQIKQLKSDMKAKKVYCITGVNKLRKKKQSSNADSVVFNTDYMSSDENEMQSEDANMDEMNDHLNVNSSIDNSDDHNYSKCLIDNSAKKHRTVHKEENQKSIPTSVTCRHTSVVPEPSDYEESNSSSSSSEYCVENEDFDETDLELSYEYYQALNASYQKRMQDTNFSESAIQTLQREKYLGGRWG